MGQHQKWCTARRSTRGDADDDNSSDDVWYDVGVDAQPNLAGILDLA
jgi:hypothetical protein